MPGYDETPTYNMKAVVRETGIKPDTLRAWERRYGLPQPQRTAGGHRLYSERDLAIVRWLLARQREGLRISKAVSLWRKLEAERRDPIEVLEYALPETRTAAPLVGGPTLIELRQSWVSACMNFDERGAEHVISQAFALYPPETVCYQVLQAGVAQVGEAWYRGEATVQQEHFTSELAMRRLEVLIATAPPPIRTGSLLIGCPPEENHTIAPLLLTLALRRRGWGVVYLGANVPLTRLDTTIATTTPRLVILTAQQLPTAATLLQMARFLQERDIPVAFGGLIFNILPTLRHRIPGHFLGQRLDLAPQIVEQLLTSSQPRPRGERVPETYREALAHYQERQPMLEATVLQAMQVTDTPEAQLAIANANLARNIIATLTLGDMKFLGPELSWIKGLLTNHGMPTRILDQYLKAYYQAAKTHLDERGEPVIAWLAEHLLNLSSPRIEGRG